MRWGLTLCSLSPSTNVGKIKDICFYFDLVVVTPTASYAACTIMEFMYGGDLGGKQICIQIGVANKVEDFLNVDDALCALQKRTENRKR